MLGAGEELRVADVIRLYAAERGDRLAVREGEHRRTYAELDERSNRLARALEESGVRKGSRVAYLDRTAVEVAELLFAVSKIGAVLVPMNWRLARPELLMVLGDAAPPVFVAGPTYADAARELAATLDRPPELVFVGDDYERRVAAQVASDPGGRGDSDDVVVQMYTSGTTGVPKGVLTTHRNLAAAAETSPWWRFDGDAVSMTPIPMFHIGGIGWTFLGLWNGATTVLIRDFVPEEVLDTMERDRVTNAVLVPTMLRLLTDVPGSAERDYSALRSIAYGASPITTPVLKAALRTFRCSFYGIYGLTESTGGVLELSPEDHDPDGPREHLLRSAGKPFPWVEVRIVDPVTGEDRQPYQVGEVWLRAPNVMAGYANRPEETAATVTPEGWLRSGDGGYVDDEGYVFLTDRIKDMIVSGGENVYPIEVEEALCQHPAVAEVAVIGVPDDRWGETVRAIVIPRGDPPAAEDLIAFARERLAGYKLPRAVEFVDDLPRTPTGKVLKRDLRSRYAAAAAPLRS